MPSVARDETIDSTNPKLDLFTSVDGLSTDVAVLAYAIFEDDGTTVVKARVSIDPTTDAPTGERLATGHFSIDSWTVPSAQPLGTYKITWYFQLTASSPEQVFTEDFEVVSVIGSGMEGYALVQDFRDEGWTSAMVTDARLLSLISRASRRIDRLTGQWFNARTGTMTLDGSGSLALRFPVPVISISSVSVDGVEVSLTSFKVYNRHLSGVHNPDDRGDPRIALYQASSVVPIPFWTMPVWQVGRQNIIVEGVFGYTDPPGPPGTTPEDIKEACMLMVAKKIPLMSDTESRDDLRRAGFVNKIRTRDQEIGWDVGAQQKALSGGYRLTGDSEIDDLLIGYMAPTSIGDTSGGFYPRVETGGFE